MEDTTVRVHPDGTLIIATPEGWLETDFGRENISRPSKERVDEAVEVDPLHLSDVWVSWVADDWGDIDDYTYDEDPDDPVPFERLAELLGRERLLLGHVAGNWWAPYGGASLPVTKRKQQAKEVLRSLLTAIAALDPSAPGAGTENQYQRYSIRNRLILQALGAATAAGFATGIDVDASEPDYPIVVYLHLPYGQVSWHLPSWEEEWDGHDTSKKYRRIGEYITGAL